MLPVCLYTRSETYNAIATSGTPLHLTWMYTCTCCSW